MVAPVNEYPLWTQNRAYSARRDRFLIDAIFETAGIIYGLEAAPNGGMNITIGEGAAVIDIRSQTDPKSGKYLQTCSKAGDITIDPAPASNSRIDTIAYVVNDSDTGGTAGEDGTGFFKIYKGTAAQTPTPSTNFGTDNYEILFYVTVPAGKTALIGDDIVPAGRPASLRGATPRSTTLLYAGSEDSVPPGWLLCNGQEVSRTEYGGLYEAIGTAWGEGDGSTTFNIPDLRGTFAVGVENMGGTNANRGTGANAVGVVVGANSKTISTSEMPSHTHESDPHVHSIAPHTHPVPDHRHTIPTHTHSIPNHVHSIDHNHPTLETHGGGGHRHYYRDKINTTAAGSSGYPMRSNSSGTEKVELSTNWESDHTHTFNIPTWYGNSGGWSGSTGGSGTLTSNYTSQVTSNNTAALSTGQTSVTSGPSGGGNAFSVVPRSAAMNYIIKA